MAKKSGGKPVAKRASADALATAGKRGAGELSETELDQVSGGTATDQQLQLASQENAPIIMQSPIQANSPTKVTTTASQGTSATKVAAKGMQPFTIG